MTSLAASSSALMFRRLATARTSTTVGGFLRALSRPRFFASYPPHEVVGLPTLSPVSLFSVLKAVHVFYHGK